MHDMPMVKLAAGGIFGSSPRAGEAARPFQGRFSRIDARRFTASIYKDGKSVSQCSVTHGGAFGGHSNREITYSNQISSHTNSYNEALTLTEDSQTLYLKPMMTMARGVSEKLSDTGAAEYLWSLLMEPIQR